MTIPAGSAVETVIPGRRRKLGGLDIRRLLPSRRRQRIGPFIFFDHLVPVRLEPGQGIDVPPHPHIDLATVTYLFEGEIVHRDSLGSVETIRPGEINWMHAGRGIVHSERSAPGHRNRESRLHGIQLWVALPFEEENTPPEFHHYSSDRLPSWRKPGIDVRVLVGDAFGVVSPVRARSAALYLDVSMAPGADFEIPPACERSVYVVDGSISVDNATFEVGDLLVLNPNGNLRATSRRTTRLMVLGGDPIQGERHIWWNFVSSSRDRIEKAKVDWRESRFPTVPGEHQRTPLPG